VKKVAKLLRNGVVGVHADGAGLYLRVKSKSNAHWEKQYQPRGAAPRTTRNGKIGYKVNYMGLGSAFVITLAEAREANRQANKLLIEKIDPLTTRRAERAQRLDDPLAKQPAIITTRTSDRGTTSMLPSGVRAFWVKHRAGVRSSATRARRYAICQWRQSISRVSRTCLRRCG
jgi:hypothetical protein